MFSVKHRKFVKQLMSLGLDRNGAEMCAAYSRQHREPYADGLARFQWIMARANVTVAKRCCSSENAPAPDGTIADPAIYNPVNIEPAAAGIDWTSFDWPPQPQPVTGCLFAIDTTPVEAPANEWPKVNPYITDAMAYAIEAMYNRKREVLA